MKSIISGAQFIEFEEGETFSGKFLRPVIRETDSPTNPNQKAGDVMGYEFMDINGEVHIVGASHQIEKALTSENEGVGNYYRITFLGKGVNSKNQPFNRFQVDRYDDENEFRALNTLPTTNAIEPTTQPETDPLLDGAKLNKKQPKSR